MFKSAFLCIILLDRQSIANRSRSLLVCFTVYSRTSLLSRCTFWLPSFRSGSLERLFWLISVNLVLIFLYLSWLLWYLMLFLLCLIWFYSCLVDSFLRISLFLVRFYCWRFNFVFSFILVHSCRVCSLISVLSLHIILLLVDLLLCLRSLSHLLL